MLPLSPGAPLERLLVIGCHPDDVEIGCGGTLLSLAAANPALEVTWVVLTGADGREVEARESAAAFLEGVVSRIEVLGFRDAYLPYEGGRVKEAIHALQGLAPQVVLTHRSDDAHQDHRLANELTWNAFRDQVILEYEVPKWDGDFGRPNVYVPLAPEVAHRKVELLERHFPSQAGRHWFDPEVFLGLMRLRGVECGTTYAEGFVGRKLALEVGAAVR